MAMNCNHTMDATDEMRVLELYSGIGGMHYALCGKFKFIENRVISISYDANVV